MTATSYFVATDEFGVERVSETPIQWTPPSADGTPVTLQRPDGGAITLYSAGSLLDRLDDVIWVAEPTDGSTAVRVDGSIEASSARLTQRTPWDPPAAARFALDCAEHAIGGAADVELPNGQTIGTVINDARSFLDSATDPNAHLGPLARLATVRRLKRENKLVAQLAYGLSIEDISTDLDTDLDTAWTSAASVADSLFAALEALRHLAFPHYVRTREAVAVEQSTHGDRPTSSVMLPTPWGSIIVGGEHDSPYLPAAIAAQEAALRGREAVRDRSGAEAEAAERQWQADRLITAIS